MFTQSYIQAQIKKTSALRVTDLCVGNSPVTSEFPAQMDSNAENVFIWWRHHEDDGNPADDNFKDFFFNENPISIRHYAMRSATGLLMAWRHIIDDMPMMTRFFDTHMKKN